MAEVTERPRGQFDVSEDKSGTKTRRGQRTIDITGATDYADAVAELNAAGIDYGEEHPDDSGAVVTGIARAYNPVSGMYTFTATYQEGGSDILTTPPTVRYEPYDFVEVVDKDLDDIPFTNSAGTPFDGGMEIEKCGVIITVRRPVAGYDFASLWPYANATNSEDLLLPDGNTVPEGAAKFKMPAMADRVTTAESCFIELKFDCRPGVKPWRKNVIDQGAEAWALADDDSDVKGVITTESAGAEPAGVVRLNGHGVPIVEAFNKIALPNNGPTLFINATPPEFAPAQAVVDPDLSTSLMKVLSFRRNASMDLNALLA